MKQWTLERWDKVCAVTLQPVLWTAPCSANGTQAVEATGTFWVHWPAWPTLNIHEFASTLLSAWKRIPVFNLPVRTHLVLGDPARMVLPWSSSFAFTFFHSIKPSFPHDCQHWFLKFFLIQQNFYFFHPSNRIVFIYLSSLLDWV